jgi:hypothetical protein
VRRLPFSILILIVACFAIFGSSVRAQTWPVRDPIYASRTADGGPLQPFTFNRPPQRAQALRVAYYAPRTQRIEPVQSTDEAPEARTPGFDLTESHPMIHGNRAVLRNGIAYAPSNAPDSVKHAIWAVNTICRRPYVWGGGHGSFRDSGYDCSGTVSFALHYAGLLNSPIPSSDFLRYGQRGHGRWFTIYSRHGHVWAMIAGLRLDTTDLRYGGDVGPRWHLDGRDTWGFEARHPVGL